MIAAMFRNVHRTGWLLLSLALACKSGGAEPAGAAEKYSVRAQVVAVEGQGDAQRVILEHEAIDNFKDRDGKAERMPAMKMAFGLAPEVPVASLTPGSKHDITFDAVWGREPMIRVIEAKPLPADTALELEEHK